MFYTEKSDHCNYYWQEWFTLVKMVSRLGTGNSVLYWGEWPLWLLLTKSDYPGQIGQQTRHWLYLGVWSPWLLLARLITLVRMVSTGHSRQFRTLLPPESPLIGSITDISESPEEPPWHSYPSNASGGDSATAATQIFNCSIIKLIKKNMPVVWYVLQNYSCFGFGMYRFTPFKFLGLQ